MRPWLDPLPLGLQGVELRRLAMARLQCVVAIFEAARRGSASAARLYLGGAR